MPPFVVSSLAKWTLSALGAAAVVHWMVQEVRRVSAELDAVQPVRVKEPTPREELPMLRPDPRTGEYRPVRYPG